MLSLVSRNHHSGALEMQKCSGTQNVIFSVSIGASTSIEYGVLCPGVHRYGNRVNKHEAPILRFFVIQGFWKKFSFAIAMDE